MALFVLRQDGQPACAAPDRPDLVGHLPQDGGKIEQPSAPAVYRLIVLDKVEWAGKKRLAALPRRAARAAERSSERNLLSRYVGGEVGRGGARVGARQVLPQGIRVLLAQGEAQFAGDGSEV